ncbi:MAG TPA: glycosyltransferase family 2 protein [Leptolyngbyaceae cyanobacterium]
MNASIRAETAETSRPRQARPTRFLDTSSLSVVIPVYNGGDAFRKCLASISAANPKPREIIVVADGPSDDSWQVAEQFGAKVLRLPNQAGPAAARNAGVGLATGQVIVFLDADVTVPADFFEKVAEKFEQFPALDALIGSYDDAPEAPNFLSQYRNLFHHYTHQMAQEQASTFWGACGAVQKAAFLAIGGFDERYRTPCIEDIELGYRLKQGGCNIRLCKDVQVKHLKRWEALSMLKTDFFQRALPWTTLIWRDRTLKNDLNLNVSSRLSVICVYSAFLSLGLALWHPWISLITVGLCLALIGLNLPVYRFFARKRGYRFAARVIPWHWLYYGYSGLAFALGTLRYGVQRSQFAIAKVLNRMGFAKSHS